MPEQDSVSLNTQFFFATSGITVHPISTGDLGPGTEGRIDAIKHNGSGPRKVKIKDNVRVIEELEFAMPMGVQGSNSELDFIEGLASGVDSEDVYVQRVDSTGFVHHEWLYSQSQVARGNTSGTDHASKQQDKSTYFLVPDDIEKVK